MSLTAIANAREAIEIAQTAIGKAETSLLAVDLFTKKIMAGEVIGLDELHVLTAKLPQALALMDRLRARLAAVKRKVG